jgi:hypothetical protein
MDRETFRAQVGRIKQIRRTPVRRGKVFLNLPFVALAEDCSMAERTELEPATPGVTGGMVNRFLFLINVFLRARSFGAVARRSRSSQQSTLVSLC